MADAKTKLFIRRNFVSGYIRGKSMTLIYDKQIYDIKLPENVGAYSGRINLNVGKVSFYTEYAHKINDPSALNKYIYRDGNGLFSNLSFSQKGLGASVSVKMIDNMSYKSNRSVTSNQLSINYLPTLTKEHTYSLAAMYPYATQPEGEFGFQGSLVYNFRRNTGLGGKYGWTVDVNYSQVNSNDIYPVNDTTPLDEPGTLGHKVHFFRMGNTVYYQDFNVEITRKFSRSWQGIFSYFNQTYNKDVIEGETNAFGNVYANIGVADITYNITHKYSLRGEFQAYGPGRIKVTGRQGCWSSRSTRRGSFLFRINGTSAIQIPAREFIISLSMPDTSIIPPGSPCRTGVRGPVFFAWAGYAGMFLQPAAPLLPSHPVFKMYTIRVKSMSV